MVLQLEASPANIARTSTKGGNRTFAAVCTNGSYVRKEDLT
jgi:hypothetical protein